MDLPDAWLLRISWPWDVAGILTASVVPVATRSLIVCIPLCFITVSFNEVLCHWGQPMVHLLLQLQACFRQVRLPSSHDSLASNIRLLASVWPLPLAPIPTLPPDLLPPPPLWRTQPPRPRPPLQALLLLLITPILRRPPPLLLLFNPLPLALLSPSLLHECLPFTPPLWPSPTARNRRSRSPSMSLQWTPWSLLSLHLPLLLSLEPVLFRPTRRPSLLPRRRPFSAPTATLLTSRMLLLVLLAVISSIRMVFYEFRVYE